MVTDKQEESPRGYYLREAETGGEFDYDLVNRVISNFSPSLVVYMEEQEGGACAVSFNKNDTLIRIPQSPGRAILMHSADLVREQIVRIRDSWPIFFLVRDLGYARLGADESTVSQRLMKILNDPEILQIVSVNALPLYQRLESECSHL